MSLNQPLVQSRDGQDSKVMNSYEDGEEGNVSQTQADTNEPQTDDFKLQEEPEMPLSYVRIFLLSNLLALIYILGQAATKQVLISQDSLSTFELAFFRSFYNLAASSVYLKFSEARLADGLIEEKRWILFTRCVSGTICFITLTFAVKYLPLAVFFVTFNACPFLTAVMACLWLKEIITLVEVFCMLGAFGGILMVGLAKEADSQAESIEVQLYHLGLICACVTVFAQALNLVTTRKLKGISVFVIQWYYAAMSTLVTGICVWGQEKPFYVAFKDSTWQVWSLIVILSILNNIGQNLATWINQRANPATVGIMQYSGVAFSFMLDVFLFNQVFTSLEVVGVCVCLFFSFVTALYKNYIAPPKVPVVTEKKTFELETKK